MATTDRKTAGYEVVEDGGGYGVLREGDPQPISHHATREQAEEAARRHSGQGSEVDARHDILPGSGDPDSAKHTFGAAALFAVAVIVLIVVVSLIIALG